MRHTATELQQLQIKTALNQYPIFIGSGASQQLTTHLAPYTQIIIVTDDGVPQQYHKSIQQQIPHSRLIVLPAGEQNKCFQQYQWLCEQILKQQIDRQTCLIALGGGVIGDLTGFVAATLLRGIAYIQVPTTLLAQVDSSIGGKTAINTLSGKNLIGAFHQPKAVFSDIDFLTTLSLRERRAGYAELLKTALIADDTFFHWLLQHGTDIIQLSLHALTQAMTKSCGIKAQICSNDIQETNQQRMLLNFGHTFAHAIEAQHPCLHGEAVAVGMAMAGRCSQSMNLISQHTLNLLLSALTQVKLPTCLAQLNMQCCATDMLHSMQSDKKKLGNHNRLILLKAIGQACVLAQVPNRHIIKAIEQSLMPTI